LLFIVLLLFSLFIQNKCVFLQAEIKSFISYDVITVECGIVP
jgi:hypothetical protein